MACCCWCNDAVEIRCGRQCRSCCLCCICVYCSLFYLPPTTAPVTKQYILRLYGAHTVWSHHIIETARATRYVYYSNLIAEEMRGFSVGFSIVHYIHTLICWDAFKIIRAMCRIVSHLLSFRLNAVYVAYSNDY